MEEFFTVDLRMGAKLTLNLTATKVMKEECHFYKRAAQGPKLFYYLKKKNA